jgi:hypothetical protein
MALRGPSIRWPNLCACCCREADTSVKLDKRVKDSSSNWFTGTTTTRYETRSWDVPYCKSCLAHIHEERAYRQFSESAIHLTWVVVIVGGIGWVIAAVASTGFGWPDALYYVWIGFLVALVVLLAWLTYPACRTRYQREVAAIEGRRAAIKSRVESNMCERCSSRAHLAVRYDGWREESHYGEWREEWHYFAFGSELFAQLMLEINGERCKRV